MSETGSAASDVATLEVEGIAVAEGVVDVGGGSGVCPLAENAIAAAKAIEKNRA